MTTTAAYTLSWILPYVRQSLRERGNMSYLEFLAGLWPELEKASVPGIVKTPPERMYSGQPYEYQSAHWDLRMAAAEAFQYLLYNGFLVPEPPQGPPWSLSQARYFITQRGQEWAAGTEPLPEDSGGYINTLRKLVPTLDPVIEQYVAEGLSAFDRRTYFAAAVMIGAASEKALYLLADSILIALKDPANEKKFRKLVEERRLYAMMNSTKEIVGDASKVGPFATFDAADSHLMSLFDAIRVQRNDAVHPMNASVSADSVRLSFLAFPHALQKSEKLRAWFQANPKTV